MSERRYYQRRINQKLSYARQLLNNDDEASIEAAIWHLSIAYKAWLAEIASDHHHPMISDDMDSAVAIAGSSREYIPVALAECVQLETNPDSWLVELLAYNDIANSIINKPPKTVAPGMIALTDSEPLALPEASKVLALLKKIAQMIERYREAMQEY